MAAAGGEPVKASSGRRLSGKIRKWQRFIDGVIAQQERGQPPGGFDDVNEHHFMASLGAS